MTTKAHTPRVIAFILLICFAVLAACSGEPDRRSSRRDTGFQEPDAGAGDVDQDVLRAEIISGPSPRTHLTTAEFVLSCNRAASCEFVCSLDEGAEAACAATVVYEGLEDGDHVLSVVAIDDDGEQSEPVYWQWTVDRNAPAVVNLVGPPQITNEQDATFDFSCSKETCSFECSLDGGDFQACEPGVTYTDLDDGPHTFSVRALDEQGNVGGAVSWQWTVDTESPLAVGLTGPNSPTNQTSATFSFECSAPGCSFACELDGGGFSPCESGVSYENLADGAHVFKVKATDQTGVSGPEIAWTWTVDTLAPVVENLNGPNESTNASSATFSFECSKANCEFSCRLESMQGTVSTEASCISGVSYNNLTQGTYTFSVFATDAAANRSATVAWVWTVDTTPPTVRDLNGPGAITSMTTAAFTFGCSEDACEFVCELESASAGVVSASAPCTSGVEYTDLTDGAHTFRVRPADAAGNSGPASTWSWTIDTDALAVENLQGPSAATNSRAATFSFECSKANCAYVCELQAATQGTISAPASCASGVNYANLADDDYTFLIFATDPSSNQSEVVTWSWTVDTIAPSVENLHGPPFVRTNRTFGYFDFECSEDACDFVCELAGANQGVVSPAAPCTSRKTYTNLADDDYTFTIYAVDAATNQSDVETWSWIVDTVAPVVENLTGPRDPTNSRGASFGFDCSKANCSFTCEVVGETLGTVRAAMACSSVQQYASLADDTYSFSVIAVDPAGNESAPATWTWTVDTVMPIIAITEAPGSETDDDWAAFEFECTNKPNCSFECALDYRIGSGSWQLGSQAACSSPEIVDNLTSGSYRFRIRALDAAGNVALADHEWTVSAAWATVTTGRDHTCGLRSDGMLWCWGRGAFGKLGLGGDTSNRLSPQRVGDHSGWSMVSAGGDHTCAIRNNGTLWCWGRGFHGQLGLGNDAHQNTPQQVGNATNWSSVASGNLHTCATRTNGTLWCWGDGQYGKLGLGNDTSNRNTPRQVGSLTSWSSVSAGLAHTCATRTNGTLWCWGDGYHGQLGAGNTNGRTTPQQVGGLTTWRSVSAGWNHSCALRDNNTLWCWGSGEQGQLGLGDTSQYTSPQQVGSLTSWIAISSGTFHTCGRRTDQTAWCWGLGDHGQLGQGNTNQYTSPRRVGNQSDWSHISAGGSYTCGIRDQRVLWCWGRGDDGRLGLGHTQSRNTPQRVDGPMN